MTNTVEGTASVKDEMGGEDLLRSFATQYRSGAQGAEMDCDTAQALAEAIDAMLAAAPSRDQVSMGALRTTFHTFHDAVDAVKDELGDRGLLNGVYGDLHDEIGNAVVNRVVASLVPTADQGVVDDPDEAYELGKRDGYDQAVQDIDLATGGDGEYRGSTFAGETVDMPVMKARIIERFSALTPPIAGAGEEPTAWLIENNGKIIEAVRGGDVLAMRRQSFDYATFTPVYSAASISQLNSRIGKLERDRDEWRDACNENAGAWEYEKTRAEAAEAELAEARDVLEPFADWHVLDAYDDDSYLDCTFQAGQFRRARSFHSPKEPDGGGE